MGDLWSEKREISVKYITDNNRLIISMSRKGWEWIRGAFFFPHMSTEIDVEGIS
jgi:hypothetical protein